jgi:hypothetical protein
MFTGDLPRQDHPLPKALDDVSAAKLLRAAQNDKRLLVRVTAEVLLRTGLRVSGVPGWAGAGRGGRNGGQSLGRETAFRCPGLLT